MRSRSSSSGDSRRNSAAPCADSGAARLRTVAVAAALCVFALAVLSAAPLGAQVVDLDVGRKVSTRASNADTLVARVSFRWDRMSELVSSLRAGMESRITFTVRLYEKRKGLLPFPADRLLAEKKAARSAFWDFLDGTFVVESESGDRQSFASTEKLLEGFLTLPEIPLYDIPHGARVRFYVTARALFEPVRLMPPLTLVSLVGRAATATTPWARKDAP
jgi:hypothetical protein